MVTHSVSDVTSSWVMTQSVSEVKHVRVADEASHEDAKREFVGGGDFTTKAGLNPQPFHSTSNLSH